MDVETVSLLRDEEMENPEVFTAKDELTTNRGGGRALHTAHHTVQHPCLFACLRVVFYKNGVCSGEVESPDAGFSLARGAVQQPHIFHLGRPDVLHHPKWRIEVKKKKEEEPL